MTLYRKKIEVKLFEKIKKSALKSADFFTKNRKKNPFFFFVFIHTNNSDDTKFTSNHKWRNTNDLTKKKK